MVTNSPAGPWRILIASSHPLFAEGLRSLLHQRQQMDAVVVGMVSSIDQALNALRELQPDLVIVDYDDERVNRDEFLARFVEGEGRLRVVLLSLKEGGQNAIVYDRRTLAASQVEDWLDEWTGTRRPGGAIPPETQFEIDSNKDLDQSPRRGNMKHAIAAGLLVVVLAVAGFFALESLELLPQSASLQAVPIDNLFRLDFSAIVVLFALIVGLMVYSIIIFRRREGDTTDGPHIRGNMKLEIAWTVVPLGFVLYLAFMGSLALGRTTAADPKPLRVDVVGSQWAWRFDYPDLGITSTELFLPVNKQALLTLSSTDVIHSFWVPEFRVKQDALPGEGFERELRITPSKVGEYKVRCAELCGRQHYNMLAAVKVLSQGDFDAWVQSMVTAIPEDPVARGDLWTQQFGCRACHSIDGSPLVGPTWKGIFGTQEELTDGTTVTVDAEYIRNSIRDPGAQIVAGFQNLMPATVGAELTDDQIADIAAFLESLK
jgi:cytochrome c oxidase subunit 2